MENRETKTGQAAQCKKTDWFKKIYGDMVDNENPMSFTLPDGTSITVNPYTFYNMSMIGRDYPTPRTTRRVTTISDELEERIFDSNSSDEETEEII